MIPNEYTSARTKSTSTDSLSTSGAVQCTLPATSLPPRLPWTSSLNLVRPKSDTLTFHLLSSSRLSDLRSLCTMPDEWRKCMPLEAW